MEHLVKLLRDSYDLQEEKSEKTAYWHLQHLRSEIKQLTLTDVVVPKVTLCEPHECLDYSQGYDRCKEQCDRCKDL